jgi:drug/metabolite transporter (DMT)-like permease
MKRTGVEKDVTRSSGDLSGRAYLALVGVILFWGLNFPVAKFALGAMTPLAFNALRFPLASLVLYCTLRLMPEVRLPTGRDRWKILLLGILGNVFYQQLFIYGLNNTRAGTASVILAISPLITALLSAQLGHEKVGFRAWIGIVLAFAGIAFVVYAGNGEAGDAGGSDGLLGLVLLLSATVAWAVYTVGSRGVVARHGAIAVTALGLWAGAAGLLIVGMPSLLRMDYGSVPLRAWIALCYSGAFSIGVAYIFWYYGVRHLGNTRASAFSNLTPIVALLAAWPIVGESPRLWQFAGAAVILAGVALSNAPRAEERSPVSGPA